MASLKCCGATARRLPGGSHSAQPKHFSRLHFLDQRFELLAHHGLQSRGDGIVEVVEVVVTEVAVAIVVLVAVAMHGEQPLQQYHEHLNDQLSKLCAQNDLHSLSWGVDVLVVSRSVVIVVVVAGAGVEAGVGAVVGAGVGTGVGAGVGQECTVSSKG